MKRVVYGAVGYGKSYSCIYPYIRDHENVIYVSAHGKQEVESTLLIYGEDREISILGLSDIEGMIKARTFSDNANMAKPFKVWGIDLADKLDSYTECDKSLLRLVQYFEDSELTSNSKITFIFTGFNRIINDFHFVQRLERWSASVLIEYRATQNTVLVGDISYLVSSDRWEKTYISNYRGHKYRSAPLVPGNLRA